MSQRHSNTDQGFSAAFEKAIKTKSKEEAGITFSSSIVRSRDFPEMSVVDYLLWALQRYILKGERRYFSALEHHYEYILDIYENGEKESCTVKRKNLIFPKLRILLSGNKNASSKYRTNSGILHGAWFYETLKRRS